MTKKFKTIKNFENYEISENGEVRNKRTGTVLHQRIGLGGYKTVMLYSKEFGKNFSRRVHRLVAETYIPNTDNLPEVDHKNHDKFDNRVENLRWVTKRENLLNRAWCKPVIMLEKKSEFTLKVFQNITEAAEYLEKIHGYSFTASRIAICQNCRGERNSAYGFKWEYLENHKAIENYSDKAIKDFWEQCDLTKNTVKNFAEKHSDIMKLASELVKD